MFSVQRHRGLERRRELLHRGSRGRARDRGLLVSSSCCLLPPEQNGHLHRKRRLPLLARLDVPDFEAHPLQLGPGEEGAAGQGGADLFLEPLAERALSLGVEDERGKRGRKGGGGGGRRGERGGLDVAAAAAAAAGFFPSCCRWREAGRGPSRSWGRRERGGRGGGGRGRDADEDKQRTISPTSIASDNGDDSGSRRRGCCIDGGSEMAATSASYRERALRQEAAGGSHCVPLKDKSLSRGFGKSVWSTFLCSPRFFTKSTFCFLLAFLSCSRPSRQRREAAFVFPLD